MVNFNTKGHCLINKLDKISVTNNVRKSFKETMGIKFPQRVKTYDIVELGHDFKPEINNTKIFTFRDKNGEIVQRNIIDTTNKDIKTTQKSYIKQPETIIFDPLDSKGDNFFDVTGRKISTITKRNGEYFEKSEVLQTRVVKDNGESVVNISKIKNSPFGIDDLEWESQSMYEYTKGHKKGYQINNYSRSKDGVDVDMLIDTHTDPLTKRLPDDYVADWDEGHFVFENMPRLSNDRYLPLHLYSFKNFKKIAPYVAEHPKHKPPLVTVKWFSQKPKNGFRRNGFFDGDVNLNSQTLKSRTDVIRSSAHEKEHAYQAFEEYKQSVVERLKTQDKTKFMFGNITAKDIAEREALSGKPFVDTKEVQKLIDAEKSYVQAEENFEKYHANYKEKKAREAGSLAVEKYMDSCDTIKDIFPYAPDYQIGFRNADLDRNALSDAFFRIFNVNK